MQIPEPKTSNETEVWRAVSHLISESSQQVYTRQ